MLHSGNYGPTSFVLLACALLLGIIIAIYFFVRRVRQKQQKRIRDAEAAIAEVKEARAMKFADDTFKGVHFPEKPVNVRSYSLNTIYGDFDVPGDAVLHPLFHPGIKRSRSTQSPQSVRYQPTHQTLSESYPRLQRCPSTSSASSIPVTINTILYKPMSPSTTMQTRQPETPLPPTPVMEIIMKTSTRSHLYQVKSIWSFSSESTIPPSSPSVHSAASSRTKIILPHPLLTPRSPSQKPLSCGSLALLSPSLSIYEPEKSRPRLHSLRPPPKDPSPSPPLPLPPPRNLTPPRNQTSPPFGLNPADYQSKSAASQQPSFTHDNYEYPPPPESQNRSSSPPVPFPPFIERPLAEDPQTIERWLDGSTGTTYSFGPILGDNNTLDESGRETQLKALRIPSLSLFPRAQSVRSSSRRVSNRGPQWIGAAF